MRKVIRFLLALAKLRTKSARKHFVDISEMTNLDNPVSVSWSQAGEDIALLAIIGDLKKGTYVDIGAHHPSRFSVTRHLYQIGWRGINVEANPSLMKAFVDQRPEDTNICAAVGFAKEFKLTTFAEPAISTVSKQWSGKFINEGWAIRDEINVPGITLREIYEQFFESRGIDLLAIDAEGSDLEVLQSLSLETLEKPRFPRWLLLEAAPPVSNALQTPAVNLAIIHGYEPQMILAMSTLLKYKG
jgi:FkbM family methyltransferase